MFGVAPRRSLAPDPDWDVFAWFAADGRCLAGLEVGALRLVLDGEHRTASAIRLAGVGEPFRGQGLFRDLMEVALRHGEALGRELTLLYAENEALYIPFGFAPLPQHAFVGSAPRTAGGRHARSIDRGEAESVIRRLAPHRAPVSRECALSGATDLLLGSLDDDDLRFAFADALNALLIYERDDASLTIVDIVAPAIPTMADIVGTLEAGDLAEGRTLFSPDLLDWTASPVVDQTGLMARGTLPPAMRRPFMLPPTTSF